MGFENGFLMTFIGNCIATIMMIWLIGVFVKGFTGMEEYEPISIDPDKVDDQDVYAIATGNEEYLAAHCILDPKVEIQNEKLEIQRLRNKYARMKVEQQIADLQNKPTKKKGVSGTQTNPLITECINALVGLGEKKSNARATVNKYFASNPNTKTVDEFISGVFKE